MATKTQKITEKVKKMAKKMENPKTDKDALKKTFLKEVNNDSYRSAKYCRNECNVRRSCNNL